MRIEGWNYLRWRNIKPIQRNGQIIGVKIIIYKGDVEEYYSFITAETYFYLLRCIFQVLNYELVQYTSIARNADCQFEY
jgi:hypothetical protein